MLNKKAQQRTVNQILSIYLFPEIKRRQNEGLIPKPFSLWAGQIIFRKNKKSLIRLNKECKMQITIKPKSGVPRKKGSVIRFNQIQSVKKIKMIEGDGNEAHISMVRVRNIWYLNFDARYDKRRARSLILSSSEFFESAKDNLKEKRWRSFVDSIFLAVESLVKAELILLPHYKSSKKHNYVKSEYNKWFSLGNTKMQYKNLLNELSGLWNKARYSEGKFIVHHKKAQKFIKTYQSMHSRLIEYLDL